MKRQVNQESPDGFNFPGEFLLDILNLNLMMSPLLVLSIVNSLDGDLLSLCHSVYSFMLDCCMFKKPSLRIGRLAMVNHFLHFIEHPLLYLGYPDTLIWKVLKYVAPRTI